MVTSYLDHHHLDAGLRGSRERFDSAIFALRMPGVPSGEEGRSAADRSSGYGRLSPLAARRRSSTRSFEPAPTLRGRADVRERSCGRPERAGRSVDARVDGRARVSNAAVARAPLFPVRGRAP